MREHIDKTGVGGGAKRRDLSQRRVTCCPKFGAYIYIYIYHLDFFRPNVFRARPKPFSASHNLVIRLLSPSPFHITITTRKTKFMPRIIIKGSGLGPKDLKPILAPLRVIHGVQPALMLHHDTPVFLHILPVPALLRALDRDRARLRVARVYLQALLVREDVHLDARVGRGERQDAEVVAVREGC